MPEVGTFVSFPSGVPCVSQSLGELGVCGEPAWEGCLLREREAAVDLRFPEPEAILCIQSLSLESSPSPTPCLHFRDVKRLYC